MAVRRERVVLDLEDNLSGGLAKNAVEARLLKKELNDLGRDSTRAGAGLDRVGASARKSSPEIDRLSGRLKVFRDVALVLGPILSPLGAATIPVLTGAIAGLGAAGAGLGVSILALQGVGDALKALDAAQLEPTAENLQALRIEMEKMGPAGADFVRFIDSIEPELKSLQMAAREGLLPGVEDGISSLLTDLPQIRDLVSQLAEAMGGLTADAGADLAGPEWRQFFEYLRTDAAPTLEQFGRTVGNFAQGFADLLVGLAPATRDFGAGLEGLSQKFADWAAGLDDNQSFQEFVDYVRQSGPQAVEMLGSLARALAGIAQAMAPYGSVVLPVLTQLLDLLALLASTDAGAALIAVSAGLVAFNRAASLSAASMTKLSATLAANPWGLAAAAMTYAIVEVVTADDELVAATKRAQDALNSGDTSQMQAELDNLNAKLEETAVHLYPKREQGFVEGLKRGIPLVGQWNDGISQAGDLWAKFSGSGEDAEKTVRELEDAIENGRSGLFGFTGAVDDVAAGLKVAEDAAADFTSSLAELDAWLSKRGAIRNYREQIQGLAKGLKDGFNRKDREQIDATADAIARVAEQITNPKARADFLKNARAGLVDMAQNAAPKARAEIEKVIAKLDEFGLTKPKSPKLDIDLAPFRAAISQAESWLNGIADEHVKIYLDRVGSMGGPGRGSTGGGGQQTAERTSGRFSGRASSVPSFSRGGSTAATDKAALFSAIIGESAKAGDSLHNLRKRLNEAEKAVDRERKQRDALVSRRNEARSAIASDLQGDLFSVSEASGNPWAAGSTPGGVMDPQGAAEARRERARRWVGALRTLKSKGVRTSALQAILAEGLEAAEFMAAQSAAYIGEFAATLNEAAQYTAQAQNIAANAVVSVAEMNAANAELRAANKTLKNIEKALKANQGTQQPSQQPQRADRSAANARRRAQV